MASGTDILFGGTDSGSKPSAPAATTDTPADVPTVTVRPQASGTSILFAPPSADTTTAKPGDIDPVTGRPYAFLKTASGPVAETLGKPIAEGQQPGADTQAIIGTATDPEQRRRIAAAQLFPDLPPKEAQARVFYGDDGRLAAVGAGGKPFYVDPLPVLAGGPAGERPTVASPPSPAPTPAPPGATWAQRVQAALPPGAYGSPSYQPPTGSVSPFTPGALTVPNLFESVGRAVPNALSVAPMIAGDAVAGPVGVGAGSFAADYARQFVANRFDPQPGGNPYDYGAYAQNALQNALIGGAAKEASIMAKTGASTSAPVTGPQAEQARLAQVAKDNNIPIYPQQAPGAGPLTQRGANVANVLPFSGVPSVLRAQAENITGAAIKEMGDTSGAKALTPEVMAGNAVRIGDGMDNILPQMHAPIMADPTALGAIQKIAADAQNDLAIVAPDSLAKAKGLIGKVLDSAQGNNVNPGAISGTDLQNMVRKGGLFDKVINGGDPYLADVARQLKATLIDSAKTAPGAAGDAAAQWQQLRYQYKVMKTLETPAIKNPDGTLTPGALQQAVRSSFGDTAMARGEAGTMGDLAKIGQMTKPLGTSGTWEHGGIASTLAGLGAGVMAIPYSGWAPLVGASTAAAGAGITGATLGMYFRRDLANKLANPGAYTGSSIVAGTAPAFVPQQRNLLQPP